MLHESRKGGSIERCGCRWVNTEGCGEGREEGEESKGEQVGTQERVQGWRSSKGWVEMRLARERERGEREERVGDRKRERERERERGNNEWDEWPGMHVWSRVIVLGSGVKMQIIRTYNICGSFIGNQQTAFGPCAGRIYEKFASTLDRSVTTAWRDHPSDGDRRLQLWLSPISDSNKLHDCHTIIQDCRAIVVRLASITAVDICRAKLGRPYNRLFQSPSSAVTQSRWTFELSSHEFIHIRISTLTLPLSVVNF